MRLFKRNKSQVSISDKAGIKIAGFILKGQQWFATGLHSLTKNWKQKQQWIFLFSVCLVFGGLSVIAVINSFDTLDKTGEIIPRSISIPKTLYKADKAFLITKKEFQQVQEYKSSHPNLMKERPGLYDTLNLIEQVYYSQQK